MAESLMFAMPDTLNVELPDWAAFLFKPKRKKALYGGRGSAKSQTIATALILLGFQNKIRILCARETMESIKESVHQLLESTIDKLGLRGFYEIQAATIIGKNGTEFIFKGLKHNVDGIKSVDNVGICWIEEAQSVSEDSWVKVVPSIRGKLVIDGVEWMPELWFSFNPELEDDPSYQRLIVEKDENTIAVKVNWRDNPWFPEVLELERQRDKVKNPLLYDHIWEGATVSNIKGAVYAAEMSKATEEGRIANVPYNKMQPVQTFWDLGYGDMTAIWFVQAQPNGTYHLIDYEEDCAKTIDHYMLLLQGRGYIYSTHWLPHDGVDAMTHKRLAGASMDRSRSIEQIMRGAGLQVRIAAKCEVNSCINASRMMLANCRFDADKCADGIIALRRYQWGEPSKSGVVKRAPVHNQYSHGADAFRTLAMCVVPVKHEPKGEYRDGQFEASFGAHSWMA